MREPSRLRAGAVVFALAALQSAGCATTRYTQSALAVTPPSTEGEVRPAKAASAISVTIEKVKLRVETMDRAPRSSSIPLLRVRVVFDPPAIGYSFDPGQAVLRSADGREWRAEGGGYRPLYPGDSVDLAFDAAVPERETFELVLCGLARGTEHIDPVTLQLSRRSGRSIDRVYWLEGLLAPLAYAPYLP